MQRGSIRSDDAAGSVRQGGSILFRRAWFVTRTRAVQTNNVPDGASRLTAFETVQEANHAASYGEAAGVAAGTELEKGLPPRGDQWSNLCVGFAATG